MIQRTVKTDYPHPLTDIASSLCFRRGISFVFFKSISERSINKVITFATESNTTQSKPMLIILTEPKVLNWGDSASIGYLTMSIVITGGGGGYWHFMGRGQGCS